ncbi:ABC transporter ATP-binding protein [[Ruminococcus] gnavus]|jgi:ATP-binding cassette subfamily B protein IrtB|uniref:ABC transporter ATP-binding protein n=1 Tax=Mediterraneibacter gnavus TaxID=33038 RepID=A0AAW6D9E7_MEDGN|nr:ABC transporter ATP-binding protein [Mediterraneibacter gnavus]MDB8679686.1 ABC transporter ATP-binding protein [Mediterraneibacter gnavus]MDB8686411.1 ABC transporter ATP-binding protein [Mediterraneibacter gnavus]MDB8690511.1 ABC transporter ATP-binding protein [Mediterraneibacter gnavus]MDU2935386.1 ABC transporter ATP-binding protein [Clostridiales bacterium]
MGGNVPFKKNKHFNIGLILTIIEGILSGSNYVVFYLLILMLQGRSLTVEQILGVAGILIVIFCIRVIMYSIGYTQNQIGGAAVSKNIRLFLGDKFKKIPLLRFTKGQIGQYVNTMTSDVNSYEQILTHKISNLAKNITLSVIIVAFISCLYLPAGIILLLFALLLIPEMWFSFRVVKKYGTIKNTTAAEAVSSIVEYVDGIQTFRAYGVGGIKNKTTTKAMHEFSDVSFKYEAHGIPINFIFNIINWLTVPLIMFIGILPWKSGEIDNVAYLLLCMLPMLLAKLIGVISVDLFSYKNLLISKNNILKVIKEPEENESEELLGNDNYEIEFKNVSFSYIQGEPVLKNISFIVPNQKLTAIVGDSGSGKSTILNLIAKYYEVNSGTILVGGKIINNLAAEQVLKQISMVDQDVFLFNDTIRENIRYARPDATDEEILLACKAANCDEFICNMEKGYDTPIGENGNLLSGGERQRISIARAILKNSPILLLDEATASLDIENELVVKEAIANLLKVKKTVVMIAHTLSIVKNADQILVVSDGGIAEMGTHDELLKRNGKYTTMWNAEQEIM